MFEKFKFFRKKSFFNSATIGELPTKVFERSKNAAELFFGISFSSQNLQASKINYGDFGIKSD